MKGGLIVMENNYFKKEVAWNISSLQARFIADTIQDGNRYRIRGDLGSWFLRFSIIRENINYELDDNTIEELDNLETEIRKSMPYWEKYKTYTIDGWDITPEIRANYWKLERMIRNYQRRVMLLLKRLGYFPLKEDKRFIAGLK